MSIISRTQSSSVDVSRQVLANSGTAMHGMPARRILPKTFSSEFRQAAPRIASAVAAEDDLHHRRRALGDQHLVALPLGQPSRRSESRQAPQSWHSSPDSLYSAGHVWELRRQCGKSSSRRDGGIASTWSRQKAVATATIVQPQ